jgi:osmoprotectant transport system permease protein
MSDLINFYGDNANLLFEKALATLGIAAIGLGVALLLALPAGVWLGHRHASSFLSINVSNAFRALPSLALIAIGLGLIGLSLINIELALIALAVPPILTNAYTAVDGVDPDAVDAARGMGMRERQVLFKVELPLSWPLIFAGIRTASVYVIATAPLAALAGGGGLGDIIVNQASYGIEGVLAAAMWVAVLALLADLGFGALQRAMTPRGIRQKAGPVVGGAAVEAADVAA